MNDFKVDFKETNGIVVLNTEGYLNNVGGEKILSVCNTHIENGKTIFLINMQGTKVVNSIGVSLRNSGR